MEECVCGVGESWFFSLGLSEREGSLMKFWFQDIIIMITFDHFFLAPRCLLLLDKNPTDSQIWTLCFQMVTQIWKFIEPLGGRTSLPEEDLQE